MVSHLAGPIAVGKTMTVFTTNATAAGSDSRDFSIESDSILVSLFVDSVGGDLDVVVYTMTESGKELEIIRFPTISAPTVELLLKKAAAAMSRIRIEATYTDAATFEVRAKGITAGQTDVKISGAANFQVSQKTISTTAELLIPASLTDREGLVIKNFSGNTLYIAETLAKAITGTAYPLSPGESLGMDLASGAELYAVADSGTIDVRIAEAGG